MERQNQPAKRKNDDTEQVPASGYSLEELLANSSREDFLLSAEDERWLDGPLIEKKQRLTLLFRRKYEKLFN
tara:strand:+ start:3935 stop:4150 length:216 start_codon:yes stop_codon:yes gene_type:complete